MKKLLLIVSMITILAVSLASAQTYTMTGSGDTVTNAATKACSLKVVNPYKTVTVQALVTKISGTVAGTITLQGTVDGTTWVTVDSALVLGTPTSSAYTATNVASQTKTWVVSGTPYLWFKLSYTGSGTMSATLKGYMLPRKED